MTDLPSGTLTFFFSDIEGSTRLLEGLGDRYSPMLERHRAIVRGEFARSGAVEVGTQGNSFFAVFPQAPEAVVASVAIQRDLAGEPWPDGTSLRVRIGLHTGEARVVADDYVGLDVHRAARIMAAAHGGQIVASQATYSLARSAVNGGIEIRDLGEHRLRDLTAPERLFQVSGDGLADEFPPLRTLDRTPNNLPTQPSGLIGRVVELQQILGYLRSPAIRLVTLTGPGGIGKTRLALQAAADHAEGVEHGVYFVDLSDIHDADGALREIARTVGVGIPAGSDLRSTLAAQLAPQELLLVLDNFEQVMSAADDVADLLRLGPRLRVLVTSREALRVRGERLVPVEPLSLPEVGRAGLKASDASSFEAVRLFLERASEARPDFVLTDANAPVVGEICARLDGLPLAIELAAARLRLFSVEDLRDRLRSRLDVLRGGARDLPTRQRTLRDTIEWSYDLLNDDEQAVFQVMSVFASARIAAIEAVASRLEWLAGVDVVEALGSLVDKSLIRSIADGRAQRLSMLETIREYAGERLQADPVRGAAARTAHAEHFADHARSMAERVQGDEREIALNELSADLGNLMAAWREFVERADAARLNVLLDVLWPLHETRGSYHGAIVLLNDLLEVLPKVPAFPARADKEITLRLSIARAMLAIRGYTDEVERLYQEALALAESAGAIPKQLPVLRSLASFHLYRGEIDKTAAIGRKMLMLAERDNDSELQMEGHVILGPSLAFAGHGREGLEHLDRALELFDPERHRSSRFRLGPSPGVAAAAVSGLLHWVFGNPETADRQAARALAFADRLHHPYSLAYATFHVGMLDLWSGRIAAARERAVAVRSIARSHDYEIWDAVGLVMEGVTTALLGDPVEGLARTERGIARYRELPTPPVFWPLLLGLHATALALAGRTDDALGVLDQAASLALEGTWDSAANKVQRADLLASLGDAGGAKRLLVAAADEAAGAGAVAIQLRAAIRLTRLTEEAGRSRGLAVLRDLLPTLTEGLDTPEVVEARAAVGP